MDKRVESVELLYNKLERKHRSLLQKEQVLANIICKFLDKKGIEIPIENKTKKIYNNDAVIKIVKGKTKINTSRLLSFCGKVLK